jgi:hypothetical protein
MATYFQPQISIKMKKVVTWNHHYLFYFPKTKILIL